MTPSKDLAKIRFVGALALGFGIIMLLLDLFAALFVLFARSNINYAKGAGTFALMLVMASTLMSCGTKLASLKIVSRLDVQDMRLNWTALILVMVPGLFLSLWLLPPLADPVLIMIVSLLLVRRAVIRLSR